MTHFEGDRDLPLPPAELWPKLSDARFLVGCVPDVVSVTRAEPAEAACVIRPGFSFVRGSLELTLQVVDPVPDTSARLVLTTRGIGATTRVETACTLAPQGAGTRLHWTADLVERTGLLKAVPEGLVKAAAQKVIADAWAALENKLAG
ncbi:MAG TPA: SRPBCC domain-containing protein [Gemmataceae bacterium]|nr:SRPBCC domain-containing protein [Gemmataceae bacterium]